VRLVKIEYRENALSVASHIAELKKKHKALSSQIEKLQLRPGLDSLIIADLKKLKLAIKDEIARLTAGNKQPKQEVS
jgi:hypothetical protein